MSNQLQLATLCYVQRDGHTLLIHRNKRRDDFHYDKWNGVGGKVDPGEDPRSGALREIKEETGLTMKYLRSHGTIFAPMFDGKKDWLLFIYTGEADDGDVVHPPEGTLHWVPDQEVLTKNLWEGDQVFVPWVMDDHVFEATLWYGPGGVYERYHVHVTGKYTRT